MGFGYVRDEAEAPEGHMERRTRTRTAEGRVSQGATWGFNGKC
jgi:hypothetical protein